MNSHKHIESLNILRAVAFLCVFISHTELYNGIFHSVGHFGVSLFFVLSGYLLFLNYYKTNRIKDYNFKSNFLFAVKKIEYLYPLHLLCTLFMTIFLFIGEAKEKLSLIVIKLLLNVLLLQEWIPLEGRSINHVSWYLCVTFFLYFTFPFFLKRIEEKYSITKALIHIVISIFSMIIIGIIGKSLGYCDISHNSLWDSNLTYWFIYCLPISRVCDFIIGINLCYLANNGIEVNRYKTLLISIILSVCACVCFSIVELNSLVMSDRWFTYVLIFIIGTSLMVFAMASVHYNCSVHIIEKILLFSALISPYAFLIHSVVFKIIDSIFYHIPGINRTAQIAMLNAFGGWIKLVLGYIITAFLSKIYIYLLSKKG